MINIEDSEFNVKLPSKDDLMGAYLTQLIIAAVFSVLIWWMADSYNEVAFIIGSYLDILILVLVGMMVSYVIISVLSSDQLIQKMNENGLYNSLSEVLGYAMIISLGSVLLNLVFYLHLIPKWGDVQILESVLFLLLLLIANLALMFFLTVITKLLGISKLRVNQVEQE